MVLKLTYFSFPGRAEVARLILTVGKIPFEDHYAEWGSWQKDTAPFGQLPILQLEDGRVLAQSGAIERYTAKLAGLVPSDPVTAAFADQWALLSQEMLDLVVATMGIADKDAMIKARQDLPAGKLGEKLSILQKAVEQAPHLAGGELSYADLSAFVILSIMQSGAFEGVPTDLLKGFPTLQAWHKTMANIDAIKAYYADATGLRLAFKAA